MRKQQLQLRLKSRLKYLLLHDSKHGTTIDAIAIDDEVGGATNTAASADHSV